MKLEHQMTGYYFLLPKQGGEQVGKRIVKIYIADPDKKVDVGKSLLHSSEEYMTDLNDQELFFDMDIKEMIQKHNKKRILMLNDEASEKAGKDIFLKPIRVRDLTMTVVDIAKF